MTIPIPRPPYDRELMDLREAQAAALESTSPQMADQLRRPQSVSLANLDQVRAWGSKFDAFSRRSLDEQLTAAEVEHVDITVPGPGGHEVTIAVFRRRRAMSSAPAIFWVHGGGMISGDRFGLEVGLIDRVIADNVVLASVEYRLAPEHPDPVPVEDVYAGLVGFLDRATAFGVDPDRVLLAGGSAGGGLAAATALLLRDRATHHVAAQLLVCPMLDDRNDTVSSRQFSETGLWDRESNEAGWTALLGDRRGGDDVSVYSAPGRATDLSGLPPTFLDVGSAEVFRDEVVAYASGIWAAGGQAELHVWPGGFHGFHAAGPQTAIGRGANRVRDEWVTRVLGI